MWSARVWATPGIRQRKRQQIGAGSRAVGWKKFSFPPTIVFAQAPVPDARSFDHDRPVMGMHTRPVLLDVGTVIAFFSPERLPSDRNTEVHWTRTRATAIVETSLQIAADASGVDVPSAICY
jgi:hypothetical protein